MDITQRVQDALGFYGMEMPVTLDGGKVIENIEMDSLGDLFLTIDGNDVKYYGDLSLGEGQDQVAKLNELFN